MKKLITIFITTLFLTACGDSEIERSYASSALETSVIRDCNTYPKECETAKAKAREAMNGGITKDKFYKIYVKWSSEMHERYQEGSLRCLVNQPKLKDDLSNETEVNETYEKCMDQR